MDKPKEQGKRGKIQSWHYSRWVAWYNFILSGINDEVQAYWPKAGSCYIWISERAELGGMRHTFLNVDTALVKTCHSLMVTERSACLPPKSTAVQRDRWIAFQALRKSAGVPRKWRRLPYTGFFSLPLSLSGVPLGKTDTSPKDS